MGTSLAGNRGVRGGPLAGQRARRRRTAAIRAYRVAVGQAGRRHRASAARPRRRAVALRTGQRRRRVRRVAVAVRAGPRVDAAAPVGRPTLAGPDTPGSGVRPSHERGLGRPTRPGLRLRPSVANHADHLVRDPVAARERRRRATKECPVTETLTAATEAELLRPHAEQLFAHELTALAETDDRPRPPSWRLSPNAVVTYLLGGELTDGTLVTPKYVGP